MREEQDNLDDYNLTEDEEGVMDEDAARFEEDDEEEDGGDGDSDEEEDRREYGIYQCLPVPPGEPDWEEEEPQTVEEYLRRVRHEARHLPDVVTAPPSSQQTVADAPHSQGEGGEAERQQAVAGRPHRASRYLAADPGVPACDPALVPSATWTRDFLHRFAQLRRRLQREHELLSGSVASAAAAPGTHGLRVAVGAAGQAAPAAAAQAELEALQLDPPSACMPELEALRGLDQLAVRRQLHSAMREVVRRGELHPAAAPRLYALSARIERPLHADTCALYRQLLRTCAGQRAALGKGGADDARLPHLNICVVLAGAFFGQDEQLAAMWDDEE